MTKGYKYMSNDDTTLYNTKWGDGVTHEATSDEWELCSEDLAFISPIFLYCPTNGIKVG